MNKCKNCGHEIWFNGDVKQWRHRFYPNIRDNGFDCTTPEPEAKQ